MFRLISCLAVVVVVLASTAQAVATPAVVIETVPVGDPNNTADTEFMNDGTTGYGRVDYRYRIGKYEVTNAQYCEFLNAVADADPNGLYNERMGGGWNDMGGISRIGDAGSYTYSVRTNRGDRPVNYVSWYDTLRFANWLHNGQFTGAQDDSTTEDGAYDMSLGSSVVRKPGAQVFLPSEDEWYKVAYYKGGGTNAGYWDYPTQSDVWPNAEAPAGTDMTNGSANYRFGEYVDRTYYTTEVGAYTAKPSDSAYGTYDQGGNLREWNEADIFGNGSYRGLRGGCFESSYISVRARYRGDNYPTDESAGRGFRVASIPEPGSITLLLFAALGLLACGWRRRRS